MYHLLIYYYYYYFRRFVFYAYNLIWDEVRTMVEIAIF
jgi:hypothetical protein